MVLSATAATFKVRTASLTWPTADVGLADVRVTRTGLAGTLDVRKASLRLIQQGTITATQGRFPMATRTGGILASDWSDVADAPHFVFPSHDTVENAPAYLPAPSAHLRAAGSPCGMQVRLVRSVDNDGDNVEDAVEYVERSEVAFDNDGASKQSSPLALVPGGIYRVQSRLGVCAEANASTGTITSADLIFDQATEDPGGIKRTVGYYASITDGLTVDVTNSGLPLNYRFRSPVAVVDSTSQAFAVGAVRTSGSGAVSYSLYDHTAGGAVSFDGSATEHLVGGTGDLVTIRPIASLPAAGNELDTVINVGTGTARAWSSYLQVNMRLRDLDQLLVQTSTPAFSPNDDGVKDTTRIDVFLHPDLEASGAQWTLTIKDPAGAVVREFLGPGPDPQEERGIGEATWDGLDQAGVRGPDAGYSATLTTGAAPGLAVSTILELDTQPPTIYGGSAYPADHSTAVFGEQPLTVAMDEEGAGIDPLDLTFTLTDETAGTSEGYLGVFLAGWARTQAIELIEGHRYRTGVEAVDLAGNEARMMQRTVADGGGFIASSIVPDASTGQIEPIACALGEPDLIAGTRTATCSDVAVTLDASSVTIGPTIDGGTGFIEHAVPLDSAVLRNATGTQTLTAYPGRTETVPARFSVPDAATAARVLPVEPAALPLGTLVVTVPSTWTEASLVMTPVATVGSSEAAADPLVSSAGIIRTPDPLATSYIMVLDDGSDAVDVAAAHEAAFDAELRHVFDATSIGYSATVPYTRAQEILDEPGVRSVERNGYVFGPRYDPSGLLPQPLSPELLPTGVSRIGAGQVDQTNRGEDIVVAILDTGIDATHPDLSGQVAKRKVCRGNDQTPINTEHGTRVAGIIAARKDGSGVVGVAPAAKLYDVQAVTSSGTSDDDIICGLDYVYAQRASVDVVNMSFGRPQGTDLRERGCSSSEASSLERAVCKVNDAGILLVAAAGLEDGMRMNEAPAIYDPVLAVTTLRDDDGAPCGREGGVDDTYDPLAPFSEPNRDGGHMIGAPGRTITSTVPGGDFSRGSGTSLASAHAAGAGALFQVKFPSVRGSALGEVMRDYGERVDDARYHDCIPELERPHQPLTNYPDDVVRVDSVVGPGDPL